MAEWTREEKIFNLLRYVMGTHMNNRKGLKSSEELEDAITYAIKIYLKEILGEKKWEIYLKEILGESND